MAHSGNIMNNSFQRGRWLITTIVAFGIFVFLGTSETVLISSVRWLSTRWGIYVDTDDEDLNIITLQTALLAKGSNADGATNSLNDKRQQRRRKQKIKAIHFIGERHSGTTWMYNHLRRCFGDDLAIHMGFTRFKHWFQYNDTSMAENQPHALVIAQFREPYSWIEAMRRENHHAPLHAELNWQQFVTRKWWMPRPPKDEPLANETGRVCGQHFHYNEVIPCSESVFRRRGGHPRYELRIDGSGQPYDSIIQLRTDKIRNFLETAKYAGVLDHYTVRYEDVVTNGSGEVLSRIEKASGVKAKCKAKPPQILSARTYDPTYVKWMNKKVDWSTEALLGYGRCNVDGHSSNDDGNRPACVPALGPLLEWVGPLPDSIW